MQTTILRFTAPGLFVLTVARALITPDWPAVVLAGVAGMVWGAMGILQRPTDVDARLTELQAKVAKLANRLGVER